MTILELMKKRSDLWNEAKAFANKAAKEDGTMADEDYAKYEEMEEKIQNLTREIKRKEREKELDDNLDKPVNTVLHHDPEPDEEKKPLATAKYKNSLLKAIRSNFNEITNDLKVGQDGSGGYLVPDEYDTRLITKLADENVVRKLGTIIKTNGLHKINVAATEPAALWVEEGGALTFGEGTFEQIPIDAHKLHVAIKVTEELLYDSAFDIESYILDKFASALANAEEDAFLNGDGKNKPAGIFNAESGGEVSVTSKLTGITADDIITLIYNLKRPYRKNAAFILSDKTLGIIRKLKNDNGDYLWEPAVQRGEPDTILGYPVYTSAFAPEFAKSKPCIAFGDFTYYNIGDRGNRSIQELKELFAGNGMVGFLSKERVDGRLVLKEAVQVLKVAAS